MVTKRLVVSSSAMERLPNGPKWNLDQHFAGWKGGQSGLAVGASSLRRVCLQILEWVGLTHHLLVVHHCILLFHHASLLLLHLRQWIVVPFSGLAGTGVSHDEVVHHIGERVLVKA